MSRRGVADNSRPTLPAVERRGRAPATRNLRTAAHRGHARLPCARTARGLELERESDILRVKRDHGCLFVRKVAPTCDLTCFAKSGFSSFQCPGGREADARAEAMEQAPCKPVEVTVGGQKRLVGCRRD